MEQKQQKIRILIIAANPKDTQNIAINEEYREIEKLLYASKCREMFELAFAPAAQIADLKQKLLDFEPQIVHFSGHGEIEGLRFQNDDRCSQIVHQDPLEDLFRLFNYCLKGIILNACNTEQQAQAYAKHVDWVIGMNSAIGDKAAFLFAQDFYRALFSGKDVDFAFQLGKNAIDTANLEDWQTPQLKKRTELPPTQPARSAQPYLPRYADDVLIHAAPADTAFAESFQTELQKHLAAKLGGLDKFRLRLQTNQEDFSQAATVIVLLSEPYLQQYGEPFQNFIQLKEKRLLLVEINKLPKPASLAEVVEYPFWQQIRSNSFTYQTTDSAYQLLMQDLVIELEALLTQLKNQQPFQDSSNKITVFINAAPEDRLLAKKIQAELAQKYHLASALPASTNTRTDIENKYRYCQAVLFVFVNGSEEWVDSQLLGCEHAASEYRKHFKVVAIHTNEQQYNRINVMLPYLTPPYYCEPADVLNYLPRFVEALQ